jgi:hypothetical protein
MSDTTQDPADLFPGEENEAGRKALRAEREARANAERRVAVLETIAANPGVGLVEDDFRGLKPDEFGARVARFREIAGNVMAPGTPPAATTEPPKPETPAEAAFAAAGRIPEGTPPPVTEQKVGRDEALRLMKANRAEYDRLKAAGRIDLGVTAVDNGGSVIFNQG